MTGARTITTALLSALALGACNSRTPPPTVRTTPGPVPSAAPTPTPISAAPIDSEWGPESGGLSLSLTIPRRLSIGDQFGVTVQCKGRPEGLPAGYDLISLWDVQESMSLDLRPVGSADATPVVLHQYRSGMPDFRDPGESAVEAAGERFLGQIAFLSAPSDNLLSPGAYICTLRAGAPNHASGEQDGSYLRPASDRAKRCWFGEVVSNGVTVDLVRSDPEKVTVFVPRVLRVANHTTSFTEADADKMTLEIPRGHVMSVSTTQVVFQTDASGARTERVQSWGIGGNYLTPGDIGVGPALPIGSEIRLVVFSTNEPAGHLWMPASGSGYRELVKRSIPIIGEHDPEPAPRK
jgi:hypothetical protein